MRSVASALALGTAAVLSPLAATAAEPLPWYVGAGAGGSFYDLNDLDATLGSGFGTYALTSDDNDAGYRVFGGWRALPWLAVEAGWMDLGKATFDATTTLPATRVTGRFETSAWFIDVVPSYTFDRFTVFGKLGVALWEAKTNTTTDVLLGQRFSTSRKERSESFKWGLGAAYDFADRWIARLEYDQFEAGDGSTGKSDVGFVSLSVAYRF
jgi:OOP family OmpA-OmpF porin